MSLKPAFATWNMALEVTNSGTTGSSTGDLENDRQGYTPTPWYGKIWRGKGAGRKVYHTTCRVSVVCSPRDGFS